MEATNLTGGGLTDFEVGVRYRKDGSLIAKVAALYIVILKDSRWGMNAGSVLTAA